MSPPRILGIVLFGAVMMGMVGALNLIDGLAALLNPDHFDSDVLVGSLTAWAWLFLVFGVLQLGTAYAIFTGSTVALWPGVVLAGANAFVQFAFLSSYPLWSAIVIAFDGIVIYAFAARAMEVGTEPAP